MYELMMKWGQVCGFHREPGSEGVRFCGVVREPDLVAGGRGDYEAFRENKTRRDQIRWYLLREKNSKGSNLRGIYREQNLERSRYVRQPLLQECL